ncbi:hypothetical protein [Formivibrio citricus]|nr:hypothetical protein [Formivibrio citricus]
MTNNIKTLDNQEGAESIAALPTDEQIHSRYLELCDLLNIAPPAFQIKPAAQMRKSHGKHVLNKDGTYSIFLSDEVKSPEYIDHVLVHELSHHALCLAGYQGSGHAWVMLATEQLLFSKAGYDVDSIIWDAKRNWPKRTYWGTWLRHVEYAYQITSPPEFDSTLLSNSAKALAIWVLRHRPEFEKYLGASVLGRKLLEKHHVIIADNRWGQFLAKWIVLTLLFGSFLLYSLSDALKLVWLKDASAVVFSATLFTLLIGFILTSLYQQATASANSLWKQALRIKSVLIRK